MPEFVHQRHKPPRELSSPRQLVIACPPLRSNVNLSRIIRSASCWGIRRIVAGGRPRVDREIARDGADYVQLECHRTLLPVLKELKLEGFQLVGMEQTTHSESLFDFRFERRTVLVIGHERSGLDEETLKIMDRIAEIPVYGLPYSLNVASATDLAMYEYCRQFPDG